MKNEYTEYIKDNYMLFLKRWDEVGSIAINDFLLKNEYFNAKGLKGSGANKFKNKMTDIGADIYNNRPIEVGDDEVVKLHTQLEKYMQLYAQIKGESPLKEESPEINLKSVSTMQLSGGEAEISRNRTQALTWYFYFLYVGHKTHDQEPGIARTILSFDNAETGDAKLVNLPGIQHENYSGTFRLINKSSVYFFDLKNSEGTRELHIKIHYPNSKLGIIFGSYTTFDGFRINSGSVILERIDNKSHITPFKPLLLMPGKSQKYEFDEIPETIQRYLSSKKRNFNKVPKPVDTLEDLKDQLDEFSPFNGMLNRFCDPAKPKIFIASPQTALMDESVTNATSEMENRSAQILDLIKILDNTWKNKYEIIWNPASQKNIDEDVSNDILKTLERTRCFILIIDEVKSISFSVIQLGYALAVAKKVLVFHSNNNASKRFETIDNNNNIKLISGLTLKQDLEKIAQKITLFMDKKH